MPPKYTISPLASPSVPLATSNSLTFAFILPVNSTTPLSSIDIASVSEAEPIVPSSGIIMLLLKVATPEVYILSLVLSLVFISNLWLVLVPIIPAAD